MFSRLFSHKLFYHLLGWSLYIAYEVGLVLVLGGKGSFLRFASFYLFDILLFYFNAHVTFHYIGKRSHVLLLAIPSIIAELFVFTILTVAVDYLLESMESDFKNTGISKLNYFRAIWRGIYWLGLSTAYWFTLRTIANAKRANDLQIQKLEGEQRETELENARLRAQINPHLLFNSLNFIYNTVEGVAPKASKGILLLADVMRYAMSDAESDGKIELYKEVEQIKHYIALNQLRFNNRLSIHADISSDCLENTVRIPPLLLLTFVENIFKHGDLNNQNHPAQIILSCQQRMLYFSSRNAKKFSQINFSKNHIGIANARTRLQNFYEDRFSLHIEENDTTFILTLTVLL